MNALFRLSFYLCLLGYLLWVILAVQRGMTLQIVGEVLLGEKGAPKHRSDSQRREEVGDNA